MKVKILIGFLIISVGINIGMIISIVHHEQNKKRFKEGIPFEPGLPPGPSPDIVKRQLRLNPEQIDKIQKMREQTHLKILPIIKELNARRSQLISLLKTESEPSKASLDSIFKDIASLQAKIEGCVFDDILHQTKEVFSPEQKQRFLKLLEGRLSKMSLHGWSSSKNSALTRHIEGGSVRFYNDLKRPSKK
ncbi:MAG: hypothetical protein AB1630_10525 [bacterium]